MNEILQNMANLLLIDYCRANNIDCSGTYCTKDGRGFSYIMRKDKWGCPRCAGIGRVNSFPQSEQNNSCIVAPNSDASLRDLSNGLTSVCGQCLNGDAIARITFHKSKVPTYGWN